ncbi:MAG: spermidine synthase [Myxococcota bacterium]
MTRAWQVVDRVDGPDGRLELRRRGDRDFLIALDGRVLMNAAASRSEEALGRVAAESTAGSESPRLLIGGLGMGFTLRAALDALPNDARVLVAEIEPAVVRWCEGPLAPLTNTALADPRVEVAITDVAEPIRASRGRFHALALDLYAGVRPPKPGVPDPHYGDEALGALRRALRADGAFARWCEQADPAFERRLARAGFSFECRRAGRGGRRHCVYLARPKPRGARGPGLG